jgi:hypothetical protein
VRRIGGDVAGALNDSTSGARHRGKARTST